jgi:hypothetical protein
MEPNCLNTEDIRLQFSVMQHRVISMFYLILQDPNLNIHSYKPQISHNSRTAHKCIRNNETHGCRKLRSL